jgi:hypothetical protein
MNGEMSEKATHGLDDRIFEILFGERTTNRIKFKPLQISVLPFLQ